MLTYIIATVCLLAVGAFVVRVMDAFERDKRNNARRGRK